MILRINPEFPGQGLVPNLHLGMVRLLLEWLPSVTSWVSGILKPWPCRPKPDALPTELSWLANLSRLYCQIWIWYIIFCHIISYRIKLRVGFIPIVRLFLLGYLINHNLIAVYWSWFLALFSELAQSKISKNLKWKIVWRANWMWL